MILRDHILPIGERTCIMGVLNITPDSFSDGGKYLSSDRAVEKARQMVTEGADMIDVGGESSRPGSKRVAAKEEISRVMPVIKALKEFIDVPLSIDTYKSEVAHQALTEGVSIVNDITALRGDPEMARTIADFDGGVVLMHMRGTPEDMQNDPHYDDVIQEIFSYLAESIDLALKAGIAGEKIVIDPGIGFGKTVQQNLAILSNLHRFKALGKPVLIGTSRKSFIGELTGRSVDERAFGTAASFAAAIINGVDIIRAHDISQMRDVARMVDAIKAV